MQPQPERAQPAASGPPRSPQLDRPQLERVVSISPVARMTYSFALMPWLSPEAGALDPECGERVHLVDAAWRCRAPSDQRRLDLVGRPVRVTPGTSAPRRRPRPAPPSTCRRGAGTRRRRCRSGTSRRRRCRRQRRDDVRARRGHLRLGVAVLRHAALDQSARRRRRARPSQVVDGSDREHERVVAGREVRRVLGGAAVAGGGDHQDAVEVGGLDGGVERVGPSTTGDSVERQRQVDDADVVVVLMVDDELQAVDRVEDRSAPARRRP